MFWNKLLYSPDIRLHHWNAKEDFQIMIVTSQLLFAQRNKEFVNFWKTEKIVKILKVKRVLGICSKYRVKSLSSALLWKFYCVWNVDYCAWCLRHHLCIYSIECICWQPLFGLESRTAVKTRLNEGCHHHLEDISHTKDALSEYTKDKAYQVLFEHIMCILLCMACSSLDKLEVRYCSHWQLCNTLNIYTLGLWHERVFYLRI